MCCSRRQRRRWGISVAQCVRCWQRRGGTGSGEGESGWDGMSGVWMYTLVCIGECMGFTNSHDPLCESIHRRLSPQLLSPSSSYTTTHTNGISQHNSVEEAAAWARVDGGSSLPSKTHSVAPTLPLLLSNIPRWAREVHKGYGKGGAGGRKVIERILVEAGLLPPPAAPAAAGAGEQGKKKGKAAGVTGLARLVALATEAFDELGHLGAWCRAVRSGQMTVSPPSSSSSYRQARLS